MPPRRTCFLTFFGWILTAPLVKDFFDVERFILCLFMVLVVLWFGSAIGAFGPLGEWGM